MVAHQLKLKYTFFGLITFLISQARAGPLLETQDEETSSGEIPRSDHAWIDNNIITGDEGDLVAMVTELQLQMKEQRITYAKQRSTMHVVQEKLQAQETALGKLKHQIYSLKMQSDHNQANMTNLQKIARDQKWGIADLKEQQQQFRQDIFLIKRDQKTVNATLEQYMDLMEITYENQGNRIEDHERKLYNMETEIQNVHDHIQQGELKFTGLEVAMKTLSEGMNPDFNKIRTVKDEHKAAGSGEGSGETGVWDTIASTVEENSNTIGHAMDHITKTEEKMNTEMKQMHHTMTNQTETMLISIRKLTNRVEKFEFELLPGLYRIWQEKIDNVQKSVVNLSHRFYTFFEWQKDVEKSVKDVGQNKKEVSKLRENLINFSGRVQYIQKMLGELQTVSAHNQISLNKNIKGLNQSLTETEALVETHMVRTTMSLKGVEFQLEKIEPKVASFDNRLVHVEVKVLNASLQSCKRENNDLINNLRIKNLESEFKAIDSISRRQETKLYRTEQDLSKLRSDVRYHGKSTTEMRQSIDNISVYMPTFFKTNKEVRKLVTYLPTDCTHIYNQGIHIDGGYLIRPKHGADSLPVYCDFNENNATAWTVIQRRVNDQVSFNRNWTAYKHGFGEVNGNFWIGNENLHHLSKRGNHSLHIEMRDMNNQIWIAQYEHFKIGGEATKYQLSVSGYHGNATDSLAYSSTMPFSTPDEDNDASSTHCAKFYTAGWWYKHCHYSNLNGRADIGLVWFNHDLEEWIQLQQTVMKITRHEYSV